MSGMGLLTNQQNELRVVLLFFTAACATQWEGYYTII